jgi:hypothetical protein
VPLYCPYDIEGSSVIGTASDTGIKAGYRFDIMSDNRWRRIKNEPERIVVSTEIGDQHLDLNL